MSLFHLPLDELTEQVLRSLIDNRVREGKTLEYKERLPGGSEPEKREFCFDVSSFANAGGGDLVYGMSAKREQGVATGEPQTITPLKINPDAETLRLQQILQSHVEPKIPGLRIRFIDIAGGGFVCIVRVPKSWTGLHLVRFTESYRFYYRTPAGRSIMDVSEIRAGFIAAEAGYERLRRFRLERIARILANDGPVDLADGPKIILHLLPFSILDPTIEWDMEAVRTDHTFAPILCQSWSHQFNFDGLVKYATNTPRTSSYVQFFRNGGVEAYVTRLFDTERKALSAQEMEGDLISATTRYLKTLGKIGVTGPLSLALTLTGIRGYTLAINVFRVGRPDPLPFREADLLVPELMITSIEEAAHTILRPAFDRIWNAAGRDRSAQYNPQGNWIEQ